MHKTLVSQRTYQSSKINILFCILNLAQGGTEKQLIELIEGLDRIKFETHLCCIRDSMIEPTFIFEAKNLYREVRSNKINFDFKSLKKAKTFVQITKLATYIYKHRIHIIVSYFNDPTVFSFIASRITWPRPVFICSFRDMGLITGPQNKKLMNHIYKHTDFFLANSMAVKNYYVQKEGINYGRFRVIYNGIDTVKFSPYSLNHNAEKLVGIVANLNRKVKRIDIFLKAAAIVANNIKDVKFLIFGDGILKNELKALSDSLCIGNRIQFMGRINEIPLNIKRLTIGVNTSETEGFSNAILEYMAAGVPVIATDTSGNKDLIQDDFNGLLFPVNDHFCLARRIQQLLCDRSLIKRIRENALQSVQQNFTLEAMIRNYSDFFIKLTKNRHSNEPV